ncbi:epidermal growth factor receptor kinase substrate 8 isoform X2 [Conger conger]|uniref:epidermal growth factor receptor kinase substrate 8 isoform X2 n=1 Tax=Conger conger TaxID=82655 RepID=UPI002A5A901F|nr:epidermal growth factor receptor kinase substrate 8 isoform X2 [Conger conger]XP_061076688.1 epidermal growth factor receptor kinase substrate 8 isoform X2 [Conger conger]
MEGRSGPVASQSMKHLHRGPVYRGPVAKPYTRKGYASIVKQPGSFQYRVEHLFTCEVDGRDVRDVEDCIAQLKVLDARGRVWGQDMVLEVQAGSLQLIDIETKEDLESLPLASITETMALLDTCIYNSMLAITVRERLKGTTSIFLFQCEEVRAELIKTDLDRTIRLGMMDMGNHVENSFGQQDSGGLYSTEPLTYRWNDPDYEEGSLPPSREEPERELAPEPQEEAPPQVYTETERNVDILNHILNDVEMFMGRVRALLAKEDKKKKKLLNIKKSKKKASEDMPASEEFATCLQKLKFGFNLLGMLNGEISNPSAPEFTHCFFSILDFLVPQCPPDLPSTIVSPLLTDQTIKLLSEEATPEEDQLWQSLGEAWNIPSSKWPDDDEEDEIPPYFPEFDDGWEPPTVVEAPPKMSPANKIRDNNRPPPPPEREPQRTQRPQTPVLWKPPKIRADESPALHMRVMYDFTARNRRELSIMKDDVVQVLDQSKQWWKVRNSEGVEGHVPHNVLVSVGEEVEDEPKDMNLPPSLNKRSKPEEVKAWLEYKEFSKITVRCLGVLNGSLLLGMSREELKQMCPEEGGRVFFQLQNVKNSLALANQSGKIRY